MKIETIYKLSCQTDNDFYETDFYSSEKEALGELSDFKDLILENDDNMEKPETEIRLESIDLSDLDDILSYSNPKIISLWLPNNPTSDGDYYFWTDIKDNMKTDLKNMIKKAKQNDK